MAMVDWVGGGVKKSVATGSLHGCNFLCCRRRLVRSRRGHIRPLAVVSIDASLLRAAFNLVRHGRAVGGGRGRVGGCNRGAAGNDCLAVCRRGGKQIRSVIFTVIVLRSAGVVGGGFLGGRKEISVGGVNVIRIVIAIRTVAGRGPRVATRCAAAAALVACLWGGLTALLKVVVEGRLCAGRRRGVSIGCCSGRKHHGGRPAARGLALCLGRCRVGDIVERHHNVKLVLGNLPTVELGLHDAQHGVSVLLLVRHQHHVGVCVRLEELVCRVMQLIPLLGTPICPLRTLVRGVRRWSPGCARLVVKVVQGVR
eukprot:m.23920 g.23920  ORF g.23920 m.23920 type:complete len:311 (+) comp4115_c0_seq1:114-1046(+)